MTGNYSNSLNHQLQELINKQLSTGVQFFELKNGSDTYILRALMDCKCRRFRSFAYDLQTLLLKFGVLPRNLPKVQVLAGKYRSAKYHSALNRPLTGEETISMANKLESLLLTEYNALLKENNLSMVIRKRLEYQMNLITRCNHSISKLLPELVSAKLSIPSV